MAAATICSNFAVIFVTPWTAARQAFLSVTVSRVCWSSCPLSWWFYLTNSSSATLFSFCLQFFPASGSFSVSWLFTSGGQSIGASASAAVFPIHIKGWFPLGLIGLILLSRGQLRSLPQHHSWKASILWCSAFFMVQLSHPYMTTGKTTALTIRTFCWQSAVSAI